VTITLEDNGETLLTGPVVDQAALLPPQHEPKVAVPVGIALAWLGYALFSERREQAADSDDGVLTGVDRPVVPSKGHVPSKV
jgi:hypothetical protein